MQLRSHYMVHRTAHPSTPACHDAESAQHKIFIFKFILLYFVHIIQPYFVSKFS
jgi:hypothetical protein